MGKRQRAYAKKERVRLIAQLGGVCCDCGKDEKLEFDCINPEGIDERHWREWDTSRRIAFYKVQYALDNIALRCKNCHNKKTKQQRKLPKFKSNPENELF